MNSLKKKSIIRIINFILVLAMILNIVPFGAFTSKVYATTTTIDRIDIASETTSVQAGVLPAFTTTTTTEHASIEAYGGNTIWVRWPSGAGSWHGFGNDTEAAFNDGSTHYGMRLYVGLDSGYQFSKDTKIYFNDVDVTSSGHTSKSITSWGGYVYIDLGLATGENPTTHTVTFDTDGGTSISNRTIVDGCTTNKPNNPTKTGYIFGGWYTDNTYTTEFNFSNAITADTTIYAKWNSASILNEIRITSETTSVQAGVLPAFTTTTTTEHASIEAYGGNTIWVRWPSGAGSWHGFGDDTEAAFNDGITHYGMRLRVGLDSGYQFSEDTKIYFNDVDVTSSGHTSKSITSWGGYVYIDLGLATGRRVTVTTYDELKEAVNGHNDNITDTSITEVKLGADIAIPASSGMAIRVVNDFTFDLNGYTLDITNDNSSMDIYYGSNNIENFTSGSLTITDTSSSQTGTIKLGINSIGVLQQNASNTGMHYKLTIDGGKFYGTSGAYNRFFEFNTNNSYYWKDKLITFDFKITKGYFEHVSTNMSSIILANDMKLNNVTFNMSFDNLTFKSGNNRLIAGNESYSIDDVVPEDTNFYIFNSSEDKQVLIADRSTSAKTEVPSSLWYEVDGYTDTSYAGIKLVKKDGFDVTAPTFDSVNYGYTSVSAKGISIYNRGTTDLQVKSVTVDEPTKFTVIGTTQPTIASKATDNTSFTIKPVDGLEAGTHTATITVTDMSDKIYTATVTFNVGAKNLPDLGIGIEGTITYGEDYAPTIIGAPELGVGDYEFKYAKKVGESYQDVDDKPTSIGSYKVTINVTNSNYSASSVSVFYDIVAKNLPYLGIEIEGTITYGEEYTPTIIGAPELGVGDYEVKYAKKVGESYQDVDDKPTSIGSYKVTINVTNRNYSASDVSVFYEIVAKTITPTIENISDQTYTGSEIKPTVVVKDGSTTLIEGTDYEVTYSNNINAGTATATISKVADSNYTFSNKEVKFTIKKAQLEKVTLRTDEIIYNGLGSFPAMDNYNRSLQELSGTLGATDVGDYTTTVSLKDIANYEWVDGTTGNLTLNWKIIQATITDASVTLPQATYRVTGSAITPEPTVVVNGRTLIKDTDYTVSYTDNTNIGTATVTVTGKNNYKGTGIATFEIADKEVLTISGLNNNEEFTYDGTSKTPTGNLTITDDKVNVSELEVLYEGTDNSYNSTTAPVNAGSYKVTYKIADSNPDYSGSVSYNFKINKAKLEKVTLRTNEIVYNGLGSFPATDNYNDSLHELSGTLGATNVGDYTTTVALKDSANYEWVDGTTGNLTLNWKIIQATPTYELPTNLTGVKGDTLADITLSGRFTWNVPSTALVVGTHTYKATYTPEDTLNYKTITDIDITVVTKDLFDVNTSVNGGNGTITSSKTNVIEGSVVELTFTPDTGYMIDKVLVNGTVTEVTNNKLSLIVNDNKDVEVSYKKIPFTITVKDVTGATITPNGAVSVNYGDNKEFTITANTGYKLVKVLVDGADKTSSMTEDKLKLENIISNIEIEVVVEKIVYEVTEGANQKYTITKNTEAKFKINADYNLFDGKVYVDDVLVESENYTSESGSTIITFKQSYIDTLSEGEHTLKVAFTDGGEATTNFTVEKVEEKITNNPKTSDNIIIFVAMFIVSVLGIAITVKYNKNKVAKRH
ncbi:repeat protein [Clostridium sp. CAG:798]|nr:repeat protein [Clostridium sp. CAG:798]